LIKGDEGEIRGVEEERKDGEGEKWGEEVWSFGIKLRCEREVVEQILSLGREEGIEKSEEW
jgi:hypothetical protein